MRSKNLLLVITLLLITNMSFGQLTKYKSTSYAVSFKNESTGEWGKWSDFEKTEVLITLDLTNDRIKVFSKQEQVYDIIKYYDKETDGDGDDTFKFHCVNEDGHKCFVRFVIRNSQNGKRQRYVDFSDMMWVYN